MVEDVNESSSESMFLQGHFHEYSRRLENLDLVFVVGKGHVKDILEDFSGLFVFGLTIVAKLMIKKY